MKNQTCHNCGEAFSEGEGYYDEDTDTFTCDLCIQQNPGILEED